MVHLSDPAHRARPCKGGGISALVLATIGLLILTACTGGNAPAAKKDSTANGVIGSVPAPATGKQYAGTITWAMPPNSVPTWIFPLNSSLSSSPSNVQGFQWQMWRPLYWTQNGATPEIVPSMSLARQPVWSDDNKTLTITMNSAYKWSDGQPVTSRDVMFGLELIKAGIKVNPANWVYYTPGYFPDDLVSASTPNPSTLVLKLSKPVNPTWFVEDILAIAGTPLPSHAWAKDSIDGPILDFTKPANARKIYNFLIAQNKSLATYATNPLWKIVNGPYQLTAYNPTSGAFTMVPNRSYGGPRTASMSNFQGVPFTSNTAEQNALKTGSIDVGYVDPTAVPQIPSIRRNGYHVFGMPTFGSALAAFNFENATGHFGAIASQLYFRQAMAHLQNQEGWIKAFMHGAGVPSYGPIATVPPNRWVPDVAKKNPYPFSVAKAVQLLEAHGWTVRPGGTSTCTRPGTGPDACGAGIPAGTRLAFNLIYANSPALYGQISADLAATAKQAGITISLESASTPYIVSHYANPYAPANTDKWAMQIWGSPGQLNLPYPTQFGFLNTGGVFQAGSYSDPTADKLINASISGSDPEAVRKEAAFLTLDLPVLWQPIPDIIWAWKTSISGPRAAFENLTQNYVTPEFWYLTGPQK
jgi:peptide/nickel transport system substrate-binding protein